MGINKYNRDNIIAEVKFVSMLPGDINKSLGILKFEELKIDSVSKNLKNLEADLKVKIKEAILWEMAFTKDVPDRKDILKEISKYTEVVREGRSAPRNLRSKGVTPFVYRIAA